MKKVNKSEKKDTRPLFVRRHIDIKTHEHKGVKVTVEINFDKGTVSLVEYSNTSRNGMCHVDGAWRPKDWVFAGRTLGFMKGWQDIFEAMANATKLATEELSGYMTVKNSYEQFIESMEKHKEIAKIRGLK